MGTANTGIALPREMGCFEVLESPFFKNKYDTKKNSEELKKNTKKRERVYINAFEIMFKPLLERIGSCKKRMALIEKCEEIINKNLNIEHIIKKNLEEVYFRRFLLSKEEVALLRYNFKSINWTKPESNDEFLDELMTENHLEINKNILEKVAEKRRNKPLLMAFQDYHENIENDEKK